MIIDGLDISTNFKASLLQGSLESVLEYPKLKAPKKNDWAEFDGLEVDLVSPVLDKKDVVLGLLIAETKIDAFITFLTAKTYRIFQFEALNISIKLRCSEISEIKKIQGQCIIKLTLSKDFPLENYVYVAPNLSAQDYGYTLDNINLSKYGIMPLEGTKDNLEGTVKFKNKLEVSSNYRNGVFVSEQASRTKEYKATLNLFIKQSIPNFLIGYNAFLYDLVRSDERNLDTAQRLNKCYYSDSKINDLLVLDGVVWCKFSVDMIMLSTADNPARSYERMAVSLGYDVYIFDTFGIMATNKGYKLLKERGL
jgi:hypothetical protein